MQTAVREDLVDIVEQPPAISFTKPDGRKGRYTFDFLVKLTDGSSIAVEVKPYDVAERRNLRNRLRYVAAAMPKTYANRVFLVTDRDLNPDTAREAGRTLMLRNRSLMQEVA